MITPKAPKDMTAPEFVDYIEASFPAMERFIDTRPSQEPMMVSFTLFLKGEVSKPAPNPFTPDQIAWMREEQRWLKSNYAVCDKDGTIVFFSDNPNKRKEHGKWLSVKGHVNVKHPAHTFLSNFISWDDEEPLCFADYAPLEGEQP